MANEYYQPEVRDISFFESPSESLLIPPFERAAIERLWWISNRVHGQASVLDIGCNLGIMCHHLAFHRAKCTGVDSALQNSRGFASTHPVDMAKKLSGKYKIPAKFIKGDYITMMTEKQYDYVLYLSVWHWLFKRHNMPYAMAVFRKVLSKCLRGLFFEYDPNFVPESVDFDAIAAEFGMVIERHRPASETNAHGFTFDREIMYFHKPAERKKLPECTAIIKTFERPACLGKLLNSLRRYYDMPIIVANDGHALPPGVELGDARLITMPYDSGLSAGRNALVAACKTPYFLLLEDDFVFTPQTQIETLIDCAREHKVDMVGGMVEGRQMSARLTIEKGIAKFSQVSKEYIAPGIFSSDKIFNFFLADTAKIKRENALWDESLKVGEHTVYFLDHCRKISIAVCENVNIGHCHPIRESETYGQHRRRAIDAPPAALEARGLHTLVSAWGKTFHAPETIVEDLPTPDLTQRYDSGSQPQIVHDVVVFRRAANDWKTTHPYGVQINRQEVIASGEILHKLAEIRHPNIMRIYAVTEQAVVAELIPGWQLTRTEPYSPNRKECYMDTGQTFRLAQIWEAILHLHQHGIAWTDCAGFNVMVAQDGHAKICDLIGCMPLTEELQRLDTMRFCEVANFLQANWPDQVDMEGVPDEQA